LALFSFAYGAVYNITVIIVIGFVRTVILACVNLVLVMWHDFLWFLVFNSSWINAHFACQVLVLLVSWLYHNRTVLVTEPYEYIWRLMEPDFLTAQLSFLLTAGKIRIQAIVSK